MRNIKKITGILVITAFALVSLAGCGNSSSTKKTDDSKTVYGQVTSIDGNTITVTVLEKTEESDSDEMPSVEEGMTHPDGEMPSMEEGMTRPDGEMPSMEEGMTPPSREGKSNMENMTKEDGETYSQDAIESMMQDRFAGKQGGFGGQQGGFLRGYETTDETLTIDAENATISKISGEMTNSAQMSDITENTILEITYSGENASKIVIQENQGKGMGGKNFDYNNNGDGTEEETAASSL